MKTQISVPICTQQFLELVNFLRSNGDPRDPVEIVSVAIDYWLDNASWRPELYPKVILVATSGRIYFYPVALRSACSTMVRTFTPRWMVTKLSTTANQFHPEVWQTLSRATVVTHGETFGLNVPKTRSGSLRTSAGRRSPLTH